MTRFSSWSAHRAFSRSSDQGDAALKFRTGYEIENFVLEVEAGELQKIDDIFVIEGHGSVAFRSLIPARVGDSYIPSNQDGASIEGEIHVLVAFVAFPLLGQRS